MTSFQSTVNAFLPTIFYPCADAHGSATIAQTGSSSVGPGTVSGAPSLGFPPLVKDGSGDTGCYQSGSNVDLGWHLPNNAAWTVAVGDSFSLMAIVAAYANQAAAFASVFGQFGCTQGAYELHVSQPGFVGTYFQDVTAGHPTVDAAFPPPLNDGLPHLIGMVRDRANLLLNFWADAQLIASIADQTTSAITNAATAQRIGCRVNCGGFFTFSGAYSHLAFFRSVLDAAAWTTLYAAMWGGNPPPAGAGVPAILQQEVLNAAKLDAIYAAVHHNFP